MNTYLIPDEYGFWDLSGRNLFFKFPKFSFIDIKDKLNLTEYFLIDEQDSENVFPEKALLEMLKTSKRKAYIPLENDIQSKIKQIVTVYLPGYLLRYGKHVAGNSDSASTVALIDEIIIGVKDNPELHMRELLKELKSDRTLSKFSHTRPTETLD